MPSKTASSLQVRRSRARLVREPHAAAAGGWSGAAALRDVHAFDIRTCAWSEVEAKGVSWNGWAGSVFAMANDGVSLLVFGGHSASQVLILLTSHFPRKCARVDAAGADDE